MYFANKIWTKVSVLIESCVGNRRLPIFFNKSRVEVLKMRTYKVVLFLMMSICIRNTVSETCEAISLNLCKNLGYNSTLMPNFMGHDSQINADLGVIINLLSSIICYLYGSVLSWSSLYDLFVRMASINPRKVVIFEPYELYNFYLLALKTIAFFFYGFYLTPN